MSLPADAFNSHFTDADDDALNSDDEPTSDSGDLLFAENLDRLFNEFDESLLDNLCVDFNGSLLDELLAA